MNTHSHLNLPDFDLLASVLPNERKALIKIEDEECIRSIQDAEMILKLISDVAAELVALFERYPSLSGLFEQEYAPFKEFIARENIF